ncbi:hypothetical protein EJ04DRAFT_609676 [Polyplosphaeria fusca]|uniref:RING-type domain-containing protein n=1 Tax=Polyplosphaeria fusca TaxID=682080 RepID=A0A9P4QSI3_9PLEO|nr:hypothetical protein EJ04DRAFT_609676 [Polyplosphaeria fusca]
MSSHTNSNGRNANDLALELRDIAAETLKSLEPDVPGLPPGITSRLASYGIKPEDRINYRAQANQERLRDDLTTRDLSLSFLMADMQQCGLREFLPNSVFEHLNTLNKPEVPEGGDFVTKLDVMAALPREMWSEPVKTAEGVLDQILSALPRIQLPANPTTVEDKLCKVQYKILKQRLALYNERRTKRSAFDQQSTFEQMFQEIEPAGIIHERFSRILLDIESELTRQVEGEDPAADIEHPARTAAFTHPCTQLPIDNCPVCLNPLALGVTTNVCEHTFCAHCLATWCWELRASSNTCPTCRTQLFIMPFNRAQLIGHVAEQERHETLHWWHRSVVGSEIFLIREVHLETEVHTQITQKMLNSAGSATESHMQFANHTIPSHSPQRTGHHDCARASSFTHALACALVLSLLFRCSTLSRFKPYYINYKIGNTIIRPDTERDLGVTRTLFLR